MKRIMFGLFLAILMVFLSQSSTFAQGPTVESETARVKYLVHKFELESDYEYIYLQLDLGEELKGYSLEIGKVGWDVTVPGYFQRISLEKQKTVRYQIAPALYDQLDGWWYAKIVSDEPFELVGGGKWIVEIVVDLRLGTYVAHHGLLTCQPFDIYSVALGTVITSNRIWNRPAKLIGVLVNPQTFYAEAVLVRVVDYDLKVHEGWIPGWNMHIQGFDARMADYYAGYCK